MRGSRKVKKHGPNAGADMIHEMAHPAVKVRHDMNPERGFTKGKHGPRHMGQGGHKGRRASR